MHFFCIIGLHAKIASDLSNEASAALCYCPFAMFLSFWAFLCLLEEQDILDLSCYSIVPV
jgi:hypothetical protein